MVWCVAFAVVLLMQDRAKEEAQTVADLSHEGRGDMIYFCCTKIYHGRGKDVSLSFGGIIGGIIIEGLKGGKKKGG